MSDVILDDGEKLITLKSAINQLSSTLATSTTYKFDTAELEYYYVIPKEDRDLLSSYISEWNYVAEGNKPQARPYWAFTDRTNYSDTHAEENSLFLVDAITGEVYYTRRIYD